MPLEPAALSRVLAALFAAHNVEEFAHFRRDRARVFERIPPESPLAQLLAQWYEPDVMAVALVALTGLAGGLMSLPANEPEPVGDAVAVVGSTALAFNAVTHVGRAVAERRYNGGLVTAPLMFAVAVALRRQVGRRTNLSARSRAVLTGVGVAAVPALIVASLEAGRLLTGGARR